MRVGLRHLREKGGEVITGEVICKVVHLCVNISGMDVKLQIGFNKQRSMCIMLLFLLVLDRRHATTT